MHERIVISANGGGPTKLAEWVPDAFDGDGGWKVEGRAELIDRERFAGNYKLLDKRRNGDQLQGC